MSMANISLLSDLLRARLTRPIAARVLVAVAAIGIALTIAFDVWHVAVLVGAAVALVADACRLDLLKYGSHSSGVVFMHASMAVAAIVVLLRGEIEIIDAAAVSANLAWIAVSYPSWRGGHVPDHYSTAPGELT